MKARRIMFAGLLCSFIASSIYAEKIVEKKAKGWKYLDKKEDPPKDWTKIEFDDSKWAEGQAPLGYGDEDIETKISFGGDEENKNLFAIFRKTVEIKDPKAFAGIAGHVIFDDAAVVYLNGKEVYRLLLPKGKLKTTTTAIIAKGNEFERFEHLLAISSDQLKAGKNVIAIRVHQHNPGSSDLAVALQLDGIKDKDEFGKKKEEAEAQLKDINSQLEGALQQDEDVF